MYTYNQIVQINKDFWNAHQQVQSHYHDEEAWPTNIKYPVVISQSSDFILADKKLTYPIEVQIYDRPSLNSKIANDIEIISDCTSIALDYIAYFNVTKFGQFLSADLVSTIEKIQSPNEDIATGVKFTLNLNVIVDFNVCQIPMDGVPVDENANVAFIVNQEGTILARVPVGVRYTVAEIRRIIDTILTNQVTVTYNILP